MDKCHAVQGVRFTTCAHLLGAKNLANTSRGTREQGGTLTIAVLPVYEEGRERPGTVPLLPGGVASGNVMDCGGALGDRRIRHVNAKVNTRFGS